MATAPSWALEMSGSKSQPQIAAAAFSILYVVLGQPFYRGLMVTHVNVCVRLGDLGFASFLLESSLGKSERASFDKNPKEAGWRAPMSDLCHKKPRTEPVVSLGLLVQMCQGQNESTCHPRSPLPRLRNASTRDALSSSPRSGHALSKKAKGGRENHM